MWQCLFPRRFWLELQPFHSWVHFLIGALLVFCHFGCQPKDRTKEFMPSETAAEQAVLGALESWKAGEPAGPIKGTEPPAHLIDTHRQPGQELVDYEILGPVGNSSQRSYAVRCAFQNPTEEKRLRFVIVGIEPLWVFRQEDYELLSHWDMVMPAPESAETQPAESESNPKDPAAAVKGSGE